MKRIGFCVVCLLCVVLSVSIPVSASMEPYNGYIYDAWNASVASVNGYAPLRVLTGKDAGSDAFNKPADFYVDEINRLIYVLDTGRNRIVVLDGEYAVTHIIDRLLLNGEETTLSEPSSLFVTGDGEIYVADTGNMRVISFDWNGTVRRVIGKPESELYPQDVEFAPRKVLVDGTGNIYVLVRNIYQGALLFDAQGEFERYYGSNRVAVTAQILADMFWRRIMNQKQKDSMKRYVPVEYNSFDIDGKGFIYTVTQQDVPLNAVKKMNPKGVSVISEDGYYGDLETENAKRQLVSQLIDINVDSGGFVNVLDMTRGRVFQYDSKFNLLHTFGGYGDNAGTFRNPVAVESLGSDVLVLDTDYGTITIFSMTEFGETVRRAVDLYNNGLFYEALEPWNEVVRLNSSYPMAYKGIADVQYMNRQFKQAMDNYKRSHDQSSYLKAFKEYRNILLRQNFVFIFFCVILVVLAPVAIGAVRRKRKLKKVDINRPAGEQGTEGVRNE